MDFTAGIFASSSTEIDEDDRSTSMCSRVAIFQCVEKGFKLCGFFVCCVSARLPSASNHKRLALYLSILMDFICLIAQDNVDSDYQKRDVREK